MAKQNPVYQCPCCNGAFTIIQGKLIPVAARAGEYTEDRGDGVIIETHTVPGARSRNGLTVETAVHSAQAPARTRQVPPRVKGGMQAPGVMKVCRPQKGTPSVSREGLEVTGTDASQDWVPEYADMTPQERHMDSLLQQQYETDLSQRGYNSTVL